MMDALNVKRISGEQLRELLRQTPRPTLLDVRSESEHEAFALPDSTLIPLQQLADRLDELDTKSPVVVYCHHGIRSVVGAMLLLRKGFTDVYSLRGGIDQWQRELQDPHHARP